MALIMDIENVVLVNPGDKLGHALILLRDALVARGWTVLGSGDGASAFENSGQTAGPSWDVFTSAPGYANASFTWNGSQPNRISKPLAWIRLREPSPSTREIVFQRSSTTSSTGIVQLVARLAPAGFTGGSASATSPPAGTSYAMDGGLDVNNVFGGTGISGPLSSNWSSTTTETKRLYALISDVARAGDVWPFFWFSYDATDAARDGGFIYESLTDVQPNDTQPWVSNFGVSFANVFGTPANAARQSWAGVPVGNDITAYQNTNFVFAAGTFPSTSTHNNGGDAQTRALRTPIGEYLSAAAGQKHARLKGRLEHAYTHFSSRNYPDTLDLTTAAARIYLGRFLFPWKQNSTPGT